MASAEQLKKLNERRGELHAQMTAIADSYGNTDEWKPEDLQKWEALNSDYDANLTALEKENAELVAASKREDQNREKADRLKFLAGENSKWDEIANRVGRDGASISDGIKVKPNGEITEGPTDDIRAKALFCWMAAGRESLGVRKEHREAMAQCGLPGYNDELSIRLYNDFDAVRAAFMPKNHGWYPHVYNTLTTHTGSSGGFTFGESFISMIEEAMLAYGGIMQVAEVIRTDNGEPMRWPTVNDTSNTGRQIGESQAVTTLDPTFGQVTWNAYKFTSDEILVPYEFLQNNRVNFANKIGQMLGVRLGRIKNTKYTTGTGAGTAKGIVTCATAGVTSASSTAIAFDEVITLEHQVDPSRRQMPGVGYMYNDAIQLVLRKLKDGNGQYLWNRGANGGAPDTLNGRPYTINQDMASSLVSGAVSMIFGEFPMYKVREVGTIRIYRLVERHRENDQDAFLAYTSGDGNLLDAGDNPVKKLTQV